jgi:hypothetical protein
MGAERDLNGTRLDEGKVKGWKSLPPCRLPQDFSLSGGGGHFEI